MKEKIIGAGVRKPRKNPLTSRAPRGIRLALAQASKSRQLYVLMALPFIYLIIFKYVPMYGAQIAFRSYNVSKGIWGSPWVGLKNFDRFIHSYEFLRILRNTLIISFYNLIVNLPFPIMLALSINYLRNKPYKQFVQIATYAPHFISIVVIVGIIKDILDMRTGIVNKILGLFGVSAINFMGEPALFSSIYVWSDMLQHVGFNCIIYVAALSSIDPGLHESAVIDGANKFKRLLYIDLPGILPMAIIMLILNTGHVLDVGFEKVFLLQNPINLKASEIIDTYVYKVGLVSQVADYSYSSAIGLFKSIINLLLLLTVNKIAQKTQQTSLW